MASVPGTLVAVLLPRGLCFRILGLRVPPQVLPWLRKPTGSICGPWNTAWGPVCPPPPWPGLKRSRPWVSGLFPESSWEKGDVPSGVAGTGAGPGPHAPDLLCPSPPRAPPPSQALPLLCPRSWSSSLTSSGKVTCSLCPHRLRADGSVPH